MRNTYKLYKKIVKILDDVLEAVFGKTIKELFYAHLREFENIDEKKCHENPRLLIMSIEDFFGSRAAEAIERHVIKRLREYPELNNVDENTSITELVTRLDTMEQRAMNCLKANLKTALHGQTFARKANLINNGGEVNSTTSGRGGPHRASSLSYIDLLTITIAQHERRFGLIVEKLKRISDTLEKIDQHQSSSGHRQEAKLSKQIE